MATPPRASFVFFGAYDPAYPRNAVIRRGLRGNGALVRDCPESLHRKFWLRYPLLLLKFRRLVSVGRASGGLAARRFIFVPEFCPKDVPLAKFLSLLTARKVVFDPLAARYETKILDWRRRPPSSLTAWWNFQIDAAAFRLADIILADTAAHKEYFCRAYKIDPGRVFVLPVGFDDAFFRPAESRPVEPGVFDVLFFGSFLPLHGVEIIAEAARFLVKETDVRFRFIGDGQTFPRVRAYAEARGLRNIEFLGRVPLSRLPAEIERASVCLGVFGRTEKARRVVPHKIFQALASGRAVITARTPAVEEFFAHRRDIFLCDEPLAGSLALAILELKRDDALRRSLADNGRRLVEERYSPPAIGRRLLDILDIL